MNESIQKAHQVGKWDWPDIVGPTLDEYSAHVQRLQTSSADLERHGSDIYLALACGSAEEEALRTLERSHFPMLEAQLSRSGFDESARKDVFQQVLLHLCAGPSPRILTYAGRASLASWLGVATMRFALQMASKSKQNCSVPPDVTIDSLVCGDSSPEVRVAIENARPQFQSALSSALDALPERDRTLLRLCFVDGLTIDRIGSMYGVHRATAARWLANIREGILKHVQTIMMRDFGLRASEFESLIFLVRSELQLSLKRVLGAA